MRHQDNHGGGGLITNGDTQWMTAGSGILHIETPPEELVASGGLFHGFQLWVNLPKAAKWSAPRYQDLKAETVGLRALGRCWSARARDRRRRRRRQWSRFHHDPDGARTRDAGRPGAELVLPWPAEYNALVYTLAGAGSVDGRPTHLGQLAVLGAGDVISARADARQQGDGSLDILVLGGRPIREPVAWGGPFVMNTKAEVMQAFEDYQAGRLGQRTAGEHWAAPIEIPAQAPTRTLRAWSSPSMNSRFTRRRCRWRTSPPATATSTTAASCTATSATVSGS